MTYTHFFPYQPNSAQVLSYRKANLKILKDKTESSPQLSPHNTHHCLLPPPDCPGQQLLQERPCLAVGLSPEGYSGRASVRTDPLLFIPSTPAPPSKANLITFLSPAANVNKSSFPWRLSLSPSFRLTLGLSADAFSLL